MKFLRAFAVLLAMMSLVACSTEDVPGTPITGVFVDSTVEGLGYECGDDPVRSFTNEDGEFTCAVGQEIRFYLGEILLGSVVATGNLEVVTPAMLAGASLNEMIQFAGGEMGGMPSSEIMSSALMGGVLQSLDEDGDPSNGIVIPPGVHLLLAESGVWDIEDESGTSAIDAIFDVLDDLEVDVVDPEEAFFHLVEESAKLMHGQYSGTVVEGEETIRVDLFIFAGMSEERGPVERSAEIGGGMASLRGHLIASAGESGEPLEIEIGAPFVEADDQLLVFDYALDAITVDVYDFDAIMQSEIEPGFDEETGMFDLSPFAPYLLQSVVLEKVVASPDVTVRDIGEFLATTPEGDEVPVDLEEMYDPRVEIYASTQPMIEIGNLEGGQDMLGGSLWVGGHAKKVDMEGYFEEFMIDWGHAALSSLDDQSLVYRGRAFFYYMAMEGGEPVELETWGDVTVTVGADGSVAVSLEGDDGSSFDASLEIVFAGVGGQGLN